MRNVWWRGPRRRHVLLSALGVLALGGLLLGVRTTVIGKDNDTPKKTASESKDKETPKKTATTKYTVASDILVPGVSGADQVPYINEEIEKLWEANKLEPAERCSDYEFIRRASLDILGRIAKLEEIDQFLKDPPRERRARLIERLLASDDYANNIANLWSNMLLTRSASKVYAEQMHLWLFDQFEKKDADWSKITTALVTATGRTNDNGAVNFILAHLGEDIKEDQAANGKFQMVPVTSRTTRLFLGLRTQCTQCHDHPFNDEWRQSHFWGINAFFRQVDAPAGRPTVMVKMKGVMSAQHELVDNPSLNTEGIVPYERRNGVLLYTKATFLDGTKMPANSKLTRREELSRFIIKSPYFSKTFVNRMWGHFFGRGFTKEVDDFGEHNPVSHPELLDRLADDWANKYNHNPRDLIRWICNSRAYSLRSIANKSNATPDAEPFFSRMLLKAMSPEQLFESLMLATQSKAAQAKDDRKKLREEWMNKLVVNFGDDEGNETSFNGTVIQALMLMNGQEINTAIMDKENGTVANVLRRSGVTPKSAMAELYLAALNRPPTEKEYKDMLSDAMINLPKMKGQPRNPAWYSGVYQDIFWAVLNSNEFFLNH